MRYQPNKNSIAWCDFKGLEIPEIIKKRPVVIIKKHKQNSRLVYVLPISNTVPEPMRPYHFKINEGFCKEYFNAEPHYVKIDMIYTVSIARLDSVKLESGERVIPVIDSDEFNAIVAKFKIYYNI